MGARESLEGCFEVLQPDLAAIGATWVDFLWAVQVCRHMGSRQGNTKESHIGQATHLGGAEGVQVELSGCCRCTLSQGRIGLRPNPKP